jgi:hypothetical protein
MICLVSEKTFYFPSRLEKIKTVNEELVNITA